MCDGAINQQAADMIGNGPQHSDSQLKNSATDSSVDSTSIPELKVEGKQDESAEAQDAVVLVQQLALSGPETCNVPYSSEGQDSGDSRGNDGDSDEEGWITPENIQEVCEQMGGAEEVESSGIAVGCITTDFAMQVSNTAQLPIVLKMFFLSAMKVNK